MKKRAVRSNQPINLAAQASGTTTVQFFPETEDEQLDPKAVALPSEGYLKVTNTREQGRLLVFPESLFKDCENENVAILLYGYIRKLAYNTLGYCWASNAKLAKTLSVSEPTIVRALKTLENAQYIHRAVFYISGVSARQIYMGPGEPHVVRNWSEVEAKVGQSDPVWQGTAACIAAGVQPQFSRLREAIWWNAYGDHFKTLREDKQDRIITKLEQIFKVALKHVRSKDSQGVVRHTVTAIRADGSELEIMSAHQKDGLNLHLLMESSPTLLKKGEGKGGAFPISSPGKKWEILDRPPLRPVQSAGLVVDQSPLLPEEMEALAASGIRPVGAPSGEGSCFLDKQVEQEKASKEARKARRKKAAMRRVAKKLRRQKMQESKYRMETVVIKQEEKVQPEPVADNPNNGLKWFKNENTPVVLNRCLPGEKKEDRKPAVVIQQDAEGKIAKKWVSRERKDCPEVSTVRERMPQVDNNTAVAEAVQVLKAAPSVRKNLEGDVELTCSPRMNRILNDEMAMEFGRLFSFSKWSLERTRAATVLLRKFPLTKVRLSVLKDMWEELTEAGMTGSIEEFTKHREKVAEHIAIWEMDKASEAVEKLNDLTDFNAEDSNKQVYSKSFTDSLLNMHHRAVFRQFFSRFPGNFTQLAEQIVTKVEAGDTTFLENLYDNCSTPKEIWALYLAAYATKNRVSHREHATAEEAAAWGKVADSLMAKFGKEILTKFAECPMFRSAMLEIERQKLAMYSPLRWAAADLLKGSRYDLLTNHFGAEAVASHKEMLETIWAEKISATKTALNAYGVVLEEKWADEHSLSRPFIEE